LLLLLCDFGIAQPAEENMHWQQIHFLLTDNGCSPDSANCAYYRVRYPYFPAHSPAATRMNGQIETDLLRRFVSEEDTTGHPSLKQMASEYMSEFSQVSAEYNGKMYPWYYDLQASVLWQSAPWLTLQYQLETYSGGAHPLMSVELALFYNGNPLLLDNLVNDRERLTAVAEEYFRADRGLAATDDLEDAGYFFENGKFRLTDNVGATKEGLLFLYNPYEIASYAEGIIEVTVPWGKVHHLLHQQYVPAVIDRR
jgi:hypothetical protein